MWRMAIRVSPCFLAGGECARIGQAFGLNKTLECREPVLIVMRTVIGLAAIGRGFQFIGEGGRPFLPREMALFAKFHCESESLRLPRLGKNGSIGIARKLW